MYVRSIEWRNSCIRIEQYQLSGQLIHVIQKEEENTEIHSQLIADGFKENRNPKYGYELGNLYFVKNIS